MLSGDFNFNHSDLLTLTNYVSAVCYLMCTFTCALTCTLYELHNKQINEEINKCVLPDNACLQARNGCIG